MGNRTITILVLLMASLVLASVPASADELNAIEYDALDDVVDSTTLESVDQPGIDILNVRILDLSGDLEISMGVNASVEEEASYTVNLMADDTDLFTFSKTSGGFTASDPIGSPVAVLGWIDPGRVVWEVSTALLDIQTKLEISTAYTYLTTMPTGAVHTDALDGPVTTNDPPTVAITWPTEDLEVSGNITVTGTASDDTAVVGVLVRTDGGDWDTAIGTDAWSYSINTTNLSDGTHFVEARSYDVELQSVIVNVTIVVDNGVATNDPPTVTITWPAGDTVSGTIDITGTAADDTAVTGVEVRIDGGEWIAATGTTAWSFQVDTTTLSEGKHTIEVVAFDRGEARSPIVTGSLWVAPDMPPDNAPPTVTITQPLDGERVWQGPTKVVFQGSTKDDTKVLEVEYRLDGTGDWSSAVLSDPIWTFDIDPNTLFPIGIHTLDVRAFDGNLYSTITTVTLDVVANEMPSIEIHGSVFGKDYLQLTFDGSAADSHGDIVRVELLFDQDEWIRVEVDNVSNSTTWSHIINPVHYTAGKHVLYARSFDGELYSDVVSYDFTLEEEDEGVPGPGALGVLGAIAVATVCIRRADRRRG